MKILLEPLHPEHIVDNSFLCFEGTHTAISQQEKYCVEMLEDEEDTSEGTPKEEVLLNKFIDYDPFGNFHATRLNTYVIFDGNQTFLKLIKDEEKFDDLSNKRLWTLYFDSMKCKVSAGAGVHLLSPMGFETLKAYHFMFSCSNNNVEYEALVHSLNIAQRMSIKRVQVFGDSELVGSQVHNQATSQNT